MSHFQNVTFSPGSDRPLSLTSWAQPISAFSFSEFQLSPLNLSHPSHPCYPCNPWLSIILPLEFSARSFLLVAAVSALRLCVNFPLQRVVHGTCCFRPAFQPSACWAGPPRPQVLTDSHGRLRKALDSSFSCRPGLCPSSEARREGDRPRPRRCNHVTTFVSRPPSAFSI
jgi:hypothetical protein